MAAKEFESPGHAGFARGATGDAEPAGADESVADGRRRSGRRGLNFGIAAALTLFILAAAGYAASKYSREHGPEFVTDRIIRGPVTRSVTATGTVNPELTVIVGTYVSGVVQEVTCDFNTQVAKGQLCAKIDPRPYQTMVDQTRANLDVSKAQLLKDQAALRYARLTRDRDIRLIKTGAVTQDAVDSAQSLSDQAEAQLQYDQATIAQREAELAAAQVNLEYTSIVAPVDGTVVSRNVTIGQTVAASFQTPTLFLIASDLTRMQVDANISESDVGGLAVGQKATFTVDAFPQRVFNGIISQVRLSPQAVQNVVTYDVVIRVQNRDLALKPGMTAGLRIVIDERPDALRVPDLALKYKGVGDHSVRGSTRHVWVLRNGRPESVAVAVGLDDGTSSEITSGELKPGDIVITGEKQATSAGLRTRFRL